MKSLINFFCPRVFVLLVLSAAAEGCGSQAARAPQAESPQNFPIYGGPAAQLFDDRIDPAAVGLAGVGENPRTDSVLRARTQGAEVVGRARVSTVNIDSAGGIPVYRLRLTLVEPFARQGFQDNQIEIIVRSDAAAFGVVKFLDTKLIGHTFVGFFRRFAGQIDGPEVRFHLSPDEPEVAAAVKDASALLELTRHRPGPS